MALNYPVARRGVATRAAAAGDPRAHPPRPRVHPGDRRITPGHFVPEVAGQYQQAPAPQGGGLVKAAGFRNYAPSKRPDVFGRIVQSRDPANKATEISDFSVCTTWGIKGKDLYLLHMLRRPMEYPELKRATREQWQAFEANVVPIEDKASGTQLIQELVEQGLLAVTRYQPQADKIMRRHAQTAMIEGGFVQLPKAVWLAEYPYEPTAFAKGKHDDQVDSTAQMLDWPKRAGLEPGGIYPVLQRARPTGWRFADARLPPLSTLFPLLRRC